MSPGLNVDTTIAAIASPPGTGAVALIRVSGPKAHGIAAAVFSGCEAERWRPRCQHFGRVLDRDGTTIDEVLLTYFPAPSSFTGEDTIEIACHGGVVVTRQVLDRLLEAGAVPAAPGEFSQRAFCNGQIDLTQAEAIMDLISARTGLAAKAAQEQLSGALGLALREIRLLVIALLAHVEAYIDFPDEDIDPDSSAVMLDRIGEITDRVETLLATADQGKILREGLRTVIFGSPNAGKSSLLNLLLGFDRAIVTEEAGTTRDTIEEVINLQGIPVCLIDTAGIREHAGVVEREGIERSRTALSRAELILRVIDASAPATEAVEIEFPEGTRVIPILNKADLPRHPDWAEFAGLSLSCLEPGADRLLREHLYRSLTEDGGINTSSLTAINARHQHCLKLARECFRRAAGNLRRNESPEFVAMDLREGLDAVGDVIGKTDVEEILGEIFSRFCIGK